MLKIFKKKQVTEEIIVQAEETSLEIALPEIIEPQIESKSIIDKNNASFLSRLKSGLSRTSNQLSDGIAGIFTKRKLDAQMVEELEELLIMADMGAEAAGEITANFAQTRYDKDLEASQVKALLAEQIAEILRPVQAQITLNHQPTVIMVVGVNGNGKTTTIGKMAAHFKASGLNVMLAAADTFRAAAVEQLQIWADRAGVPIVTGAHEADPASVAFAALQQAQNSGIDVLLIDTAGRLQNKANLMQELQKIKRVLGKAGIDAPHHILMVLDGTTGQNAISQVKAFAEMVDISGLIITKLDGTAKGGIVVALAKQFSLPVHFIGVGEGVDDLQQFDAINFANNIMGL
jgi:fused signal recognition particle receptor